MRRSELELKTGSILRKELLEDIYEFPRIAIETYYSSYSDGILYGLEFQSDKETNHHIITPGALKYRGNIYFLAEQIEVENTLPNDFETNYKYRLCFEEQSPYRNVETQTIYELKLIAVQSEEYEKIKDKSFYYCRVEYVNNGLKRIKDDNTVYGLFAGNDGYEYKLPNWVLKDEIQSLLEEKDNKHPLDYTILNNIYERKGLSVTMANLYLKECGIEADDYYSSPNKLVSKLKETIDTLKYEVKNKIDIDTPDDVVVEISPDGGAL